MRWLAIVMVGFLGVAACGGDEAAPTVTTDATSCPIEMPALPSDGAEAAANAAVERELAAEGLDSAEVITAYPSESPAPEGRDYAAIPISQCGEDVGERTWVVETHNADLEPSESLSNVQYFVSRFEDGWAVWGNY